MKQFSTRVKQNGISDKLLRVLSGFLENTKQRVTLNGKVSSWAGANAEVPQESILGPLPFLVYNLADDRLSNEKYFPDDTSLFSVIHDVYTSANEPNNGVYQINKWVFQWKISFNPDPSKQAQKTISIRNTKNIFSSLVTFK